MLNEESVRRFAAVDALIALARARIYGHSQEEMEKLRQAKQGYFTQAKKTDITSSMDDEEGTQDPVEVLVNPVKDVMEGDASLHVRSRAAVALLFLIAAGAGRKSEDTPKTMLLRHFRSFVEHQAYGSGVGFDLIGRFFDGMLYEIIGLDRSLVVPAMYLAQHWAMVHATPGPTARLLEVWEHVLRDASHEAGAAVGESMIECLSVGPQRERIAQSAAAFLRRRALDICVISVDAKMDPGRGGIPEPLPHQVAVEMEKYCAALWHVTLTGPSAETRHLAVDALGGIAVLAGHPFRVEIYERLCELVKARGLGLRIVAEKTLDNIDTLFYCRERFEEAREKFQRLERNARTWENWMTGIWKLAAEASSAAQILLGTTPPQGWQPLGPYAQRDVMEAEERLGDYRRRGIKAKLVQRQAPAVISAVSLPSAKAARERHGLPAAPAAQEPAPSTGSRGNGALQLTAGPDSGSLKESVQSKAAAMRDGSQELVERAKTAGLSAAYAVTAKHAVERKLTR